MQISLIGNKNYDLLIENENLIKKSEIYENNIHLLNTAKNNLNSEVELLKNELNK